MREKMKELLSLLIIILLLPYVATTLINGSSSVTQAVSDEIDDNDMILLGILAKEISVNAEPEAIKAQAVIARTNLLLSFKSSEELDIEYLSLDEMEKLWGEDQFLEYYEYFNGLIAATNNETIKYNNELIAVPFHAISAGKTRDGNEVYNTQYLEYLKGVDSKKDISSTKYLKIEYISKSEFIEKVKAVYPQVTLDEGTLIDNIKINLRDSADYVLQVQIADENCTGVKIRDIFGLNSSCFFIDEYEEKIRILTKGLGDGLGLSQYGANQMALEGSDYKDILNYYFHGITIEPEIMQDLSE